MVVRRRGFHIFYTIGSHMAVRLSALRAGRPLPPGRFLVLISVRGWVDPRAIVWLGGLGQLKNPATSSGIEPDLPTCSIVPQANTLPHARIFYKVAVKEIRNLLVLTTLVVYPALITIHNNAYIPDCLPLLYGAGLSQSVQWRGIGCKAGVRFPLRTRDSSFLHSVQTGSGSHPACLMVTGGFFPGIKGPELESTTHLHPLPRSKMVEMCLHFPMRLHDGVLN
jgi:hypothetical protein